MNQRNISSSNCPACAKSSRFLARAMALFFVLGLTLTIHAMVPADLRPAPLRLPPRPSGFETEAIFCSSDFININEGIAHDDSFRAFENQIAGDVIHVREIFQDTEFDGAGDGIAFQNFACGGNSFSPVTANFWRIEGDKANIFTEHSGLRGNAGGLEILASRPNLAIQYNALGHGIQKGFWRMDDIAAARPESFSIPKSAATVELFRPEPSGDLLAFPIAQQSHFGLINHCEDFNSFELIVNYIYQNANA